MEYGQMRYELWLVLLSSFRVNLQAITVMVPLFIILCERHDIKIECLQTGFGSILQGG